MFVGHVSKVTGESHNMVNFCQKLPGVRKFGLMGFDVSLHSSSSWKFSKCDQRADFPIFLCKPCDQTRSSKSHRLATNVFSSTPKILRSPE